MSRPTPRADVALMSGYHSPQVDAAVRLNTNEASEPPPPEFDAELRRRLGEVDWHRYPDRAATRLREAIAELEGTVPERVFAANGSNEVLQSLLLAYGGAGRKALVYEPTYAMHSHIARVVGTTVVTRWRDHDLRLVGDQVVADILAERPSVTFVCSPNNPTGMIESRQSVVSILAAAESIDGLVIVDEAYGQFAPWSALELVDDDRSLAVTRTFSKTWSMAGLRLGYVIAPEWLIGELDKVVLPYHLDSFTQLAGEVALGFEPQMRQRVAAVVEQRGRLEVGLAELGVEQWPSGANFILFRTGRDGDEVWRDLVSQSVLVRNCAGWPGVEGCLRVTVGTPAENEAFLKALQAALGR